MHTPDHTITEGGGNQRRLSSRSSDVMRPGQSTATDHVVVDEPSSKDNEDSSATVDRGDVNEEDATDEMDCSAMNIEEVQDQYNCTDECDGCSVEILSHYWHAESG